MRAAAEFGTPTICPPWRETSQDPRADSQAEQSWLSGSLYSGEAGVAKEIAKKFNV